MARTPAARTNARVKGLILMVSGVALLAAGCATTAEIPPQAVGPLLDLRNGLIDGRAQIQKTTGAARDLLEHPRQDVPAQVNAFRSQVGRLSRDALHAREVATGAQTRADEFFANWEKQLQTMSGSMAEGGQQRRAESMASFAKLSERLTAVRAQFSPFLADLQEADRYLQSDATAAGVKAAAPTIRKALDREKDLLRSIDDLIGQIDAVRGGK